MDKEMQSWGKLAKKAREKRWAEEGAEVSEIPKEAMPVVRILRKEVPRPKVLPKPTYPDLNSPSLRWGDYCPMGLYATAIRCCPETPSEFLGTNRKHKRIRGCSVSAFWEWWDYVSPEQATEAMDAIWGKKQK